MLSFLRRADWDAIFGSALALVLLLTLIDSSPPPSAIQNHEEQQSAESDKEKESASVFLHMGNWIERNHTGIEAASTLTIALFTIALAIATKGLWEATNNVADDARLGRERTERAFVKISHRPFERINDTRIKFTFEVKNFGRTPARVTDVIVNVFHDREGNKPPDNLLPFERHGARPPKAFLVVDDSFFHNAVFGMTDEEEKAMREGKTCVWLQGYVDYIDAFGRRHRGGYGRVFATAASNFVYVASETYNFDRLRNPGEGIDWDEE